MRLLRSIWSAVCAEMGPTFRFYRKELTERLRELKTGKRNPTAGMRLKAQIDQAIKEDKFCRYNETKLSKEDLDEVIEGIRKNNKKGKPR